MTQPFDEPFTTEALRFAVRLLDTAPFGALTVVDEHTLARQDLGWDEIARGLQDVTEVRNQTLVWVDCGGGKHGTGQWLARNFGSSHLTSVNDHDPDFLPFAEMFTDGLPPELDMFGTPTLTCVAKRLQDMEAAGQAAVLVLDDIAGARPYAAIGCRQLDIADGPVRDGARHATFTWRADDLATFAATRPDAPTIVATHDDDPGRAHLMERAALVLPRPKLVAVA